MNRFLASALFAFLLTAPQFASRAHAQAKTNPKFEGTISYSVSIPQLDDEKHPLLTNVKGDKIESEMDLGAQGSMKTYVDKANHKVYFYNTGINGGYVMDLPNDSAAAKNAKPLDLKPSGQKLTVAGHPAEEYIIKGKQGADISLWMSSDFQNDMRELMRHVLGSVAQDPVVAATLRQLSDKGLTPVKMEVKSAGELALSTELTKVEMHPIDDKIFVLPANAKFGPMPAGMGGGE